MDDDPKTPPREEDHRQRTISSFITKITSSSSRPVHRLLQAHEWDVDAAVSGFNDFVAAATRPVARYPRRLAASNLGVDIPRDRNSSRLLAAASSSSHQRLRSPRSPRSPRNLFSREAIQQADRDFDEQQHDLAKESSDDEEVERDPVRPRSEILFVTPQVVPRTVTIWRNGFNLDDNPLSRFDDPEDASFLKTIESLESPRTLDSPDGKLRFAITLIRRQQQDFPEPFQPFQGVGRTLAGSEDSVSTDPPASSSTTEPTPSIHPTAPTLTSIKIILADGTPIVSRFNPTHHTIRDVRDFIDATRPHDSTDYHLLINIGFPPKTLLTNDDLDQTIHEAGISNSVLTQKFY